MPQENISSLVTLFDPDDDNVKNLCQLEPISLVHPSTGEDCDFLFVTSAKPNSQNQHPNQTSQQHHIYEVQSLETKYGSFFLGSHVLSNGTLYVASRMDPLFFVLYHLSKSPTVDKWKPLDQLEIPEVVRLVISSNQQYQHLCQVNDALGDDMILYKLSENSVFQWLRRKQDRAFHVLLDQAWKQKENELRAASSSGTMSQGFHLIQEDPGPTTSSPPTLESCSKSCLELSMSEQAVVHQHSMQVVCEYLTPEWRTKYMTHLGQCETVLMTAQQVVKACHDDTPKRIWEEMDMEGVIVSGETKRMKSKAQSVGLKRLQKVSTKGMKSLSSFFMAKK